MRARARTVRFVSLAIAAGLWLWCGTSRANDDVRRFPLRDHPLVFESYVNSEPVAEFARGRILRQWNNETRGETATAGFFYYDADLNKKRVTITVSHEIFQQNDPGRRSKSDWTKLIVAREGEDPVEQRFAYKEAPLSMMAPPFRISVDGNRLTVENLAVAGKAEDGEGLAMSITIDCGPNGLSRLAVYMGRWDNQIYYHAGTLRGDVRVTIPPAVLREGKHVFAVTYSPMLMIREPGGKLRESVWSGKEAMFEGELVRGKPLVIRGVMQGSDVRFR